jgi:hypothetical protein
MAKKKKRVFVKGWINSIIMGMIRVDERGYVTPIPLRNEPITDLDIKVKLVIEEL